MLAETMAWVGFGKEIDLAPQFVRKSTEADRRQRIGLCWNDLNFVRAKKESGRRRCERSDRGRGAGPVHSGNDAQSLFSDDPRKVHMLTDRSQNDAGPSFLSPSHPLRFRLSFRSSYRARIIECCASAAVLSSSFTAGASQSRSIYPVAASFSCRSKVAWWSVLWALFLFCRVRRTLTWHARTAVTLSGRGCRVGCDAAIPRV